MEWADLLGTAASAASGGIFGFVGSIFGGVSKYFQRKQELAFEREKWDREERMFKLTLDAKQQDAENELAIIAQDGSWKGLVASQQSAAQEAPSYLWVNALKSLFRPALTTTLLGCTMVLFFALLGEFTNPVADSLTSLFTLDEAREMLKYIVNSVVFTSCTAVIWWFGDRAFAPPGMKNR